MANSFQQFGPPQAQSSSWGKRLLIGCLGFSILGLLLCAGAGYFGFRAFRQLMGQLEQFTAEYTDQGYDSQTGQVIDITVSPTNRTVYMGQMVNVKAPIDVDIAIIAQIAQINADLRGNLDFTGQNLMVAADAVIDGNLHIKQGQVVTIEGKVLGKITGVYQSLQYQGKLYEEGEFPPEPEAATNDFKIELDPPTPASDQP